MRSKPCKKKVVQTTELDAPQKSESKLATRLLLAPCAPRLSRSQPLAVDPTDCHHGLQLAAPSHTPQRLGAPPAWCVSPSHSLSHSRSATGVCVPPTGAVLYY